MAITRETKELKLISDINNLDIDELEEKYLKDEETFKRFVDEYTFAFRYRLNYQLRVSPLFDKIYTLYRDGIEMYPSDDVINNTAKMIDIMAYLRGRYQITGTNVEDRDQSMALFREIVGADVTKYYSPTYSSIVEGLYESSLAYDNKGNFNISDYMDFITEKSHDKSDGVDLKRTILDYRDEHPLCKMCNNLNYLYFVNYLVKQRSGLVDNEFLENAKGIMEMSKFTYLLDGVENEQQRSDYRRLCRHTTKTIKEYEKQIKKEEKEAKKTLRKELLAGKNRKKIDY